VPESYQSTRGSQHPFFTAAQHANSTHTDRELDPPVPAGLSVAQLPPFIPAPPPNLATFSFVSRSAMLSPPLVDELEPGDAPNSDAKASSPGVETVLTTAEGRVPGGASRAVIGGGGGA
jgi:hypothetical protein